MQNALSEPRKHVQMSLESREFRRNGNGLPTGHSGHLSTSRTSTGKSRADEITKRHHGYQRIPSVFENAQKTVLPWKQEPKQGAPSASSRLSIFDNLENPPDTPVSEACQNSGADAFPIGKGSAKDRQAGT
jgi:hypothetical protein